MRHLALGVIGCCLLVSACSAHDADPTGNTQSADTIGKLGDVDGDGIADITLTGGSANGAPWTSIPVAFSRSAPGHAPSFLTANTTTTDSTSFALYATQQGAKATMGDFDGDGRADVALVGGLGWTSIPVARALSTAANPNGTFAVTNTTNPTFASYAQQSGAQVVAGDFNGDGFCDLALAGGGWNFVVVAYSTGSGGTFSPAQQVFGDAMTFATYATQSGARLVAADFDHDHRTDLALTGGVGWTTVPVLFFRVGGVVGRNNVVGNNFPLEATQGALPVAGDFDADGYGDIALVGGRSPNGNAWTTVPVAFSNGDGSFTATNNTVTDFPLYATQTGAQAVAGDYDGDGRADLALTGGSTQVGFGTTPWTTIPVAFSLGRTGFTNSNVSLGVGQFPLFATQKPTALSGSEARRTTQSP